MERLQRNAHLKKMTEAVATCLGVDFGPGVHVWEKYASEDGDKVDLYAWMNEGYSGPQCSRCREYFETSRLGDDAVNALLASSCIKDAPRYDREVEKLKRDIGRYNQGVPEPLHLWVSVSIFFLPDGETSCWAQVRQFVDVKQAFEVYKDDRAADTEGLALMFAVLRYFKVPYEEYLPLLKEKAQ